MTTTTNGHQAHPQAAQQLLDRLNEPQTAAALNKLLDNAELLAFSVDALDGFIRRGDHIASNVAESVAEFKHVLPDDSERYVEQLPQLLQQLPQLVELTTQLTSLTSKPEFKATMEVLSNPDTLSALNRLLSNIELVAFLVTSLDALARRGDTLTENVRGSLRDVGALAHNADTSLLRLIETMTVFLPYLPRLVAVAPKFVEIIEQLQPFVASEEFAALLDSGVFHPETVRVIGKAGDSFVESYEFNREYQRRLGPLGLVGVFNDPDVQRAFALIADFGRRFGQSLKK